VARGQGLPARRGCRIRARRTQAMARLFLESRARCFDRQRAPSSSAPGTLAGSASPAMVADYARRRERYFEAMAIRLWPMGGATRRSMRESQGTTSRS
jgi:hypothetical protein